MKKYFTLSKPAKNVLCFDFKTQYYLTSTFMRIQEYYESPFKSIKDKFFTHEKYVDLYANNQKDKEFSYFTDWNGFNIPGDVALRFMSTFGGSYSTKEKVLIDYIGEHLEDYAGEPFYIIGTHGNNASVVEHELCHAYYYLYPPYKGISKRMLVDKNILPAKIKRDFKEVLLKLGYEKKVLDDELNAYLSTSSQKELNDKMGILVHASTLKAFSNNLRAFRRDLKVKARKNNA
jgi:hypothetical protein